MRKSKYATHVQPHLDLIRDWREQGWTEKQVAAELNIAYSSLSLYKLKYSELSEVLKLTKQKLVVKLKRSLYNECQPYETTEIHEDSELEPIYGENNKVIGSRVVKMKRKKVTKKVRPNPTLLIFALCNLVPEEFQRVDKDIIEKLKGEIEGIQKEFTSKTIENAFYELYPEQKPEVKNGKNKSSK